MIRMRPLEEEAWVEETTWRAPPTLDSNDNMTRRWMTAHAVHIESAEPAGLIRGRQSETRTPEAGAGDSTRRDPTPDRASISVGDDVSRVFTETLTEQNNNRGWPYREKH
jgi:hypothetical protein